MITIRGFWATKDPESSERFVLGHKRVLEAVGVMEVTSAKNDWVQNENAFVIIVENKAENKVLGGARLHLVHKEHPLPLISATKDLEPKIESFVNEKNQYKTAELCGLWNSIEVAGLGIGSVFLIRACVAVAPLLGLGNMMALCSPYTTRMAANYGFAVERSLGVDGTFYYPKLDLLATIVFQNDILNLPNANQFELERILSLRNDPKQMAVETNKKYSLEVQYALS